MRDFFHLTAPPESNADLEDVIHRTLCDAMTDAETFNELMGLMNWQRDDRETALLDDCRRAWSRGAMIGDKNVLTRLGHMSADGFQRVLDAHPSRPAHESIANVDVAFAMLDAARNEIIKVYGQFHAQVVHDRSARGRLEEVITAATKEVYTFSCASHSLVQAYRHFKSAVPQCAVSLDELVAEIFGGKPIAGFVKDLRTSYNHRNLFKANPSYTVSWGECKTVETNLRFDRKSLLRGTEWTAGARRFLESSPNLDVIEIMNTYFALAKELHGTFVRRCGLSNDPLFKDYLRLLNARETIGVQVSLGLLLQGVSKRSIDPYVYIPRFLTAEEAERVMCLPNNSAEQVDYMISLKDPMGLCSGETRRSLYKLFRVDGELPASATG